MSDTTTSQPITPELRRGIIEQATAGHAAPVVLQSMLDAGWNEDVAASAMESVLRDHLNDVAVQQGLGFVVVHGNGAARQAHQHQPAGAIPMHG